MYFLGTVTGSSGSSSNEATGPSGLGTFKIPMGTKALFLLPSVSGLQFEFGAATGTTLIGFATTQGRSAQLAGPNLINGPYRVIPNDQTVIAIYNSAGGFVSCRVYAAPT